MKLIIRLVLLCAAALVFAAAKDEDAKPASQPAPQDDYRWPTSVIPPTASWATVFSSNWR